MFTKVTLYSINGYTPIIPILTISDHPSEARFTEQFIGLAAKILGAQNTLFESMEAVETAKKESMWAPFRTEGEWELARFGVI